jgi:acyl phosphate:glycerol-3-phosphate acyltransferase
MGDRAWRSAAIVTVSYLSGAIPFSQLAARRRGVDLRSVDNGTVSGTSLYRVAGFAPLAIAGSLDVAKGVVGPLLASRTDPALAPAAAAAGVAGHNWSVFLGGAGGRGVSPALGALGATAPAGTGVLLGGLIAGRFAKQTGLGCFVASLVLLPVVRWVHGRAAGRAAAAILVPMLAKRLTGNRLPSRWTLRTVISRLVLDRDPVLPARRTAHHRARSLAA